jgi:hypothetical protein
MPPRPAHDTAGPAERRAPAIVTRLVSAGLVIVAAGVVISAMSHGSDVTPQARVAANTDASLVVTDSQPAIVRLRTASRVGDAILLRVDPVGSAGARTLVAAPGARVTTKTGVMSLQQLLEITADTRHAIHDAQFRLAYDAIGQVVGLTQTA